MFYISKRGDEMEYQFNMLMTEKEYNGNLLDQLTLLERIELEALKDQAMNVLKIIEFEKGALRRKLYQTPPLEDKK